MGEPVAIELLTDTTNVKVHLRRSATSFTIRAMYDFTIAIAISATFIKKVAGLNRRWTVLSWEHLH